MLTDTPDGHILRRISTYGWLSVLRIVSLRLFKWADKVLTVTMWAASCIAILSGMIESA